MNRSVTIHAVVLVALLAAAYMVWTREPAANKTEIPLLSLRAGLDQATYVDPDRTVTVARRKDDRGAHYWVSQVTLEKPPPEPVKPTAKKPEPKAEAKKPEPRAEAKKPEPKAEAKKPEPKAEAKKPEPKAEAKKKPEPKAKPRPRVKKSKAFKGGKAAEEMMKGLANMTVLRSLGAVSAAQLKEFGLTGSKKTLTLKSGSATRVLVLGSNTFGNMDTYIQDKQDGRVYVIRPRLISDFPHAEYRLMDRELHTFKRKEIEKVVVAAGAGKKVLLQQNRRAPAKAFWADESAPRKRKELYNNWMDKLGRLSVMEYVAAGKAPTGLKEELAVQYFDAAKSLGQLRLYSAAGQAPKPGAKLTAPGKDFFARTGNTRGLVKVSGPMAGEILRDAAGVLK